MQNWQQELRDIGYRGSFELAPLIEACGMEFNQLINLTTEIERPLWRAECVRETDGLFLARKDGPTPEEAVGKALHRLLKVGPRRYGPEL